MDEKNRAINQLSAYIGFCFLKTSICMYLCFIISYNFELENSGF